MCLCLFRVLGLGFRVCATLHARPEPSALDDILDVVASGAAAAGVRLAGVQRDWPQHRLHLVRQCCLRIIVTTHLQGATASVRVAAGSR